MSDTSTAELTYRHVKDRVLTGELEGGRMISEGEVAAAMGASRTPVREAFLRLEVEGWLRLYPKRGALVVPVAPGEIEEVLDARVLVEGHAAAAVVARPDDLAELLADLDETITRQEAAHTGSDLPAYATADADIHQRVADAGPNSLLSDFYRGLRERHQRMTAQSLRGRRTAAAGVIDEHRHLRDLLAAGDVTGFTAALADHLESTHGHRPGGAR